MDGDDESRSYWVQKEGRSYLMNNNYSHAAAAVFGVGGGDSWEEQAFAEDAAVGGGCVWPPRSYTCTFCRREFRSAQALGGHMNVHRRDRAKLKQQVNVSANSTTSNQILESTINTTPSLDRLLTHHHHQVLLQNNNPIINIHQGICSTNNNSNTSFDLDHHHNYGADLFSSNSSTKVSSNILKPFTCSFTQEQQKPRSPNLLSWSKFEPRKLGSVHLGNNQDTGGCTKKVLESNSSTNNSKKNNYEANHNLTAAGKLISLSSVLVRKRPAAASFHDDDDREVEDGLTMFKKSRRLIDHIDDDDLFRKNSNSCLVNNINGDDEEVIEEPVKVVIHEHRSSPNSTLETNLDLELRLGT